MKKLRKKTIKKMLTMLTAALLLTLLGGQAMAQDTAAIYVNGQYLRTDSQPLLAGGTTFVPLRAVSSALGAEISWQNDEAKIVLGGKTIILRPNSTKAAVNGQTVQLDAAPKMQAGRIMVPLRFVSEQLGAKVDYNSYGGAHNVVDITPAAGSVLPVNCGYAGAAEAGQYIYLASNGIYKIDKQSGAQTKLPIDEIYPDKLCFADGGLYYSHNKVDGANIQGHKLYFYDLASGKETLLIDGAYRPYRYGDWLYYLDTPQYQGNLYRVRLANGAPQGQAEKLAEEVFDYYLLNDALYYNMWNTKFFRADLDGANRQKLASSADYGQVNVSSYNKIVGGRRIDEAQVYGNIVYLRTSQQLEYAPGRNGSAAGPLFASTVDGQKSWQLTEEPVLYFYVLRDKILYQAKAFDEQGNIQYPWRLIDNNLQNVAK